MKSQTVENHQSVEAGSSTCPNCGNQIQSEFCDRCGQHKIEQDDLTFGRFLRQVLGQLFEVDSKVLLTLKLFLLRPGVLTYEYLQGRRAAYVSPIRLFIVFSAIYFFGPAKVYISQSDGDYFEVLSILRFTLAVPLFALILSVFWIDRKMRIGAHFVFAFHYFSFDFLIFTLTAVPLLFLEPEAQQMLRGTSIMGSLLALYLYLARMLWVVYDTSILRAVGSAAIILVLDVRITGLITTLMNLIYNKPTG